MTLATATRDMWLPIVLSLVAFGSFSWALRGHFETAGRIPNGMRVLSLVSLIAYLTYVGLIWWGSRRSAVRTALGLIGFVVATVLFWWTVRTTKRPRARMAYTDLDPDIIYTVGPYAYIRHPFYMSYIIFWISTAVLAGKGQVPWVLVLSMWYIYLARNEERRFGLSALAAAYRCYQERTGMLLPRLGSRGRS
jgi:protein-S-isoprenylcysteine O-methyltransferase Ste14